MTVVAPESLMLRKKPKRKNLKLQKLRNYGKH